MILTVWSPVSPFKDAMDPMGRFQLLTKSRNIVITQHSSIKGVFSFPWRERSMSTVQSYGIFRGKSMESRPTYALCTRLSISATLGSCSSSPILQDQELDDTYMRSVTTREIRINQISDVHQTSVHVIISTLFEKSHLARTTFLRYRNMS